MCMRNITCRSELCPTKSQQPHLDKSYYPSPCFLPENIQRASHCSLFLKGSVVKEKENSNIQKGNSWNSQSQKSYSFCARRQWVADFWKLVLTRESGSELIKCLSIQTGKKMFTGRFRQVSISHPAQTCSNWLFGHQKAAALNTILAYYQLKQGLWYPSPGSSINFITTGWSLLGRSPY